MARSEFARRRRLVGGLGATLLALTFATGCGTLNDYSATERTTAGSVNVDAGPLALRNLRVELNDGERAGSVAALLRGTFLNAGDRDDELLRVTSPVADAVQLAGVGPGSSQTVPLTAGGKARLEHPEDPRWVLEGTAAELQAGTSIPVVFHFAHQGRVAATVPVAAG